MNFGESLRLWRKAKGLEVKELAELSGVTTRTIYYIEKDEHTPNWETVQMLLKALDLRISFVPIEKRTERIREGWFSG